MGGINHVFHLAAMVSVPESIRRPRSAPSQCHRLPERPRSSDRRGVRRVCFGSSAAIYGDNPVAPKHEAMAPAPRSPYAITKLDGEYYCRLFADSGMSGNRRPPLLQCRRPATRPHQRLRRRGADLHSTGAGPRPITVLGDGGQTRDFVAVHDVVAANVFATTQPGLTGVFNVGYGGKITIIELARRIIAMYGSRSIPAEPQRPDVRHSRADIVRLLAAGFKPTGSLDRGIEETIAHLRNSTPNHR